MDMIEQKANVAQYNPTIDVMNIAACIAVVALHVNGGIWSFTRNLNWAIMLITECVCCWAVPVFFYDYRGNTFGLPFALLYKSLFSKALYQNRYTVHLLEYRVNLLGSVHIALFAARCVKQSWEFFGRYCKH